MKSQFSLLLAGVLLTSYSPFVLAHGWVEFPSARQNTCFEDGGFWSNNIPNSACKKAFEMSGTYPFIQRNEVASLNADYNNISVIRAAIPDGHLCSAGSEAKYGLDIPSPNWQKTPIKLNSNGEIELVFNATAPHNPSFWEFYLTKPGYDSSQPLTWGDLELVDSEGNVPVEPDKRYRIMVSLPTGRTGDAILFTRWQRIDPAGEGFYNCSDITFSDSGSPVEPNPPSEPDESVHELVDIGPFVTPGFEPVEVSDTVRFRTFNKDGKETTDIQINIAANNVKTWATELSGQFNEEKEGKWFIGTWNTSMNHYMFDSSNIYNNRVFASSKNPSYQLSLIKGGEVVPDPVDPDTPPVDPGEYPQYSEEVQYQGGDIVYNNGVLYECMSGITVPWCSDAAWAYAPGTGTAWEQAWKKTKDIAPGEPEEPPIAPDGGDYPQYVEGTQYQGGDIVSNKGKLYECMKGVTVAWCAGAAWAYEPGAGTAWQQAWVEVK